jgi:uncharacterized membrane protein
VNWSSYEIFSVISGVVLWAVAAVPVLELKERAIFAVCGVLFAGYGFYVASQDYGTFVFPVAIFALPVGAVAHALVVWHRSRTTGAGTRRTDDSA